MKLKNILSEIDDNKIIKYKDKDGKPAEMKAKAAKTMPMDHPAKKAWDDEKAKEGGGEASNEKPKGADLFKTKETDKTAIGRFKDDSVDDMEADMNNSEDAAMDYEEDIENALLDSLGGDGDVEVAFDDFDTKGNPVYTVEIDGEDKEITVDQKTGEIYDYSDMYDKGFDKKGTAYGNVNESKISSGNIKLKDLIQR